MRSRVLVVSMFLALSALPAQACRVGGDQVLFDATPPRLPPAVAVLKGRFTNRGSAFEQWKREAPVLGQQQLIGVLTWTQDAPPLPVYHLLTSCTHGLFGDTPHDRQAYLVGRLIPLGRGRTAFQAAGDLNGSWVNLP